MLFVKVVYFTAKLKYIMKVIVSLFKIGDIMFHFLILLYLLNHFTKKFVGCANPKTLFFIIYVNRLMINRDGREIPTG